MVRVIGKIIGWISRLLGKVITFFINVVKGIFIVFFKIVKGIFVGFFKIVKGSIKIVNGILIGFIGLLVLLLLASMIIDNLLFNGYFYNWIVNQMFIYNFSFVFSILENNFQQIIFFTAILAAEIVVAIILNIIIKKLLKDGKIKTSIKNFVNFIAYILIAVQTVLLCFSVIVLNYAIDVYKKTNPNEAFDFSPKTIEKVGAYLLDRQSSSTMLLGQIIQEIQNGNINIGGLSDYEYRNLAINICNLFQNKGNVDSEDEHYLRNYFSRAPATLSEMVETIRNKKSIFNWKLLTPNLSALHMYGKDGEYNLKFISEDGYFEAVYNKAGILLTEENDPLNMGTFNYADTVTSKEKHTVLDILPYMLWGNTKDTNIFIGYLTENQLDEKYLNDFYLNNFNENPDAVERYNEIYERIYGDIAVY